MCKLASILLVLMVLVGTACATTAPPPSAPAASKPAAVQAPGSGGPLAAPATGSSTTSAAAPGSQATTPGASPPQPLDPPQTVRVETIGIAAEAPLYLAIEQGYFKELGIDIEMIPLRGSSDTVTLLSSGQLDVGDVAISPGLFNAVARDVGIRLAVDAGSTIPGRSTPSLAIRTDILEQKPWSGYQDLRGMRVAIQQPGSIPEYYLELMLQRGGLQRSDVEVLTPFPYPDMVVAFANQAIDAALYNEPFATLQEQQGIIKKVVYMDEVDPNGNVAAYVYSESFARNTPAARNYMVAYLRGIRDYWDAYDGRKDFQLVVDVLQKYTVLKDEVLIRKVPPTGFNPAGYLFTDKLASIQEWFAARGQVPQKADLQKAYDPSFLDYANTVLGPYQPVATPRRPG